MDNANLEPGTVIGNVNILDMTNATEQSIAAIKKIRDVNILLYSKETAYLVPRLVIDNLNTSAEVSTAPKITTGQLVISKESILEGNEPIDHVVVGQLLIEPDVTPSDLERTFASLVMVGQLLCPEPVMGVLKSKMKQMVGQSMTYAADCKLVMGKVILNESQLNGLDDNSELMVLGSLIVPGDLPVELMKQKIAKMKVLGNVRCPEEYAGLVRSRTTNAFGHTDIVPTGYIPIEKPLVLDDATLDVLPGKKLYCTAGVQIASDITSDRLNDCIEGLVSKRALLCPSSLRSILAKKCDLLETKAVFYEGTLWLVTAKEQLGATRFKYLEGKATLVVEGKLEIDADVEPDILAERLEKVYNFGKITCTPGQRDALESRIALNEGKITGKSDDEDDDTTLGSVNHLTL